MASSWLHMGKRSEPFLDLLKPEIVKPETKELKPKCEENDLYMNEFIQS